MCYNTSIIIVERVQRFNVYIVGPVSFPNSLLPREIDMPWGPVDATGMNPVSHGSIGRCSVG